MPDKFKIGLITDSRRVSKYVRQFIEWAETQDHLYISNLIIQDIHRSQLANIHNGKFLLKKPGIIHSLQRASFALITKLESIVISVKGFSTASIFLVRKIFLKSRFGLALS